MIKAFLSSIHFESWFGVVIAIAAALASELLFSTIRHFLRWCRNRNDVRKNAIEFMRERNLWHGNPEDSWHIQWAEQKAFWKSCSRKLRSAYKKTWKDVLKEEWNAVEDKWVLPGLDVLLYLIGYFVFLLLGVVAYSIANGTAIWPSFVALWNRYYLTMIIIPMIVSCVKLIDGLLPGRPRVVLLLLLVIILAATPFLVTYTGNHTGLTSLVMSEFKRIEYPFVTRFYDVRGFYGYIKNGYVHHEEEEEKKSDETLPELPMQDPTTMKFIPLMDAAKNCDKLGNRERLKLYIDAAYKLFQNGEAVDESGREATSEIALMWFYKGSLENNAEWYYNAGIVYAGQESWSNARLCYIYAYNEDPQEKNAIAALYALSQDPEETDQVIKFILRLQNEYTGELLYFDEIREKMPNSFVVQLVGIMRDVKNGYYGIDDYEIVQSFLDNDKYGWCPKLKLLEAYWRDSKDYTEIYQNFIDYPHIFEPEDMVNLAWMLYMNGEYSKAYNILAQSTYPDEKAEDIVPDTYLLACELALQDGIKAEGENLLQRLSEINLSAWYNSDNNSRFNIDVILLSSKLNRGVDTGSLVGSVRDIFLGENFTQKLILATASFEAQEYEDCVIRCREIEYGERLHEVLFLKADALIAWEDDEHRMEHLEEAEQAMVKIRSEVEGDYLESLHKLYTIYGKMGNRQEEMVEVNKILEAFN